MTPRSNHLMESDRSSHGAGRVVRTAEKALFSVLFAGFIAMAAGFAAQLGGGAPQGDGDGALACAPASSVACAPRG